MDDKVVEKKEEEDKKKKGDDLTCPECGKELAVEEVSPSKYFGRAFFRRLKKKGK